MTKSIVFAISIVLTLGVFSYTAFRVSQYFRLTKAFPVKDWGKRFVVMMKVAIFQSKILRYPFIGFLHALVFWGFIVILIGSIEMIIDGLFGTERIFSFMGYFYDLLMALGDISAFIISTVQASKRYM